MIHVTLALAGLLLTPPGLPQGTGPTTAELVSRKKGTPAPRAPAIRSTETARVADWIATTGDNHGLPYAIIDKKAAALLLFDAQGKELAQVPVLLGIASGDDASPGIGSKDLSEIGPAEKTTPAGRFLAKFGLAAGKQRVLWVDYATSVAIHTIPQPGKAKERRRQRMLSATSEDNRITFGCINVPVAFYTKTLSPLFRRKGGYVYILPDVKSLEEVFPRIRIQPSVSTAAS